MGISMGLIMHWLAASLLIAMATFALLEAKSSSLIPKSLFIWPLAGILFGFLALASLLSGRMNPSSQRILFLMGLVMVACSLQALLSNIRKIPRWPSGAVWLGWILVGLVYQFPYGGAEEPAFHTFYRRVSGFIWAAIGITKVAAEKTIQEGGIPAWIQLLYVQAILLASAPH